MVRIPHIALPNLLARQQLVPELLQDAATPEALGAAVLSQLEDTSKREQLIEAFTELHLTLRQNADEQAAKAIAALLSGRNNDKARLLEI
jgi:lipid-A-disaccharide synthase